MEPQKGTGAVDELALAGRENLDPQHVSRYDAKEDAGAPAEMAMLAQLGIGAGPTVVDLGAGTGQFTLEAATVAKRVIAVDVSPVMQARLRGKLDAEVDAIDISPAMLALAEIQARDRKVAIRTQSAGLLSFAYQPNSYDLVVSEFALHHLPDFWKAVALARIAAMLRPGGIFRLVDVVFGFEPSEAGAALERWYATADSADVAVDWTRAELEEHVADEHSTFTWLLEPMLERAGLRIERADYSEDAIFASYVCRR